MTKLQMFALLIIVGYGLLPIDLLPDFIPVLGQSDDLLLTLFFAWVSGLLSPQTLQKMIGDGHND